MELESGIKTGPWNQPEQTSTELRPKSKSNVSVNRSCSVAATTTRLVPEGNYRHGTRGAEDKKMPMLWRRTTITKTEGTDGGIRDNNTTGVRIRSNVCGSVWRRDDRNAGLSLKQQAAEDDLNPANDNDDSLREFGKRRTIEKNATSSLVGSVEQQPMMTMTVTTRR
jgi:hypothetical protein